MVSHADTVEQFHGVYLLYCTNPKYKGRVYIGYTVDPNRRIKQHNKGKKAGGAWRTSNRGPWVMVMIVHGFPNDIAALRFEWAWQHPNRSRRLNHVAKKKPREQAYNYCLRVLAEMFQVGPWSRLPLTIRWLDEEYVRDFPSGKLPPIHMPICHGQVISKKISKSQASEAGDREDAYPTFCMICFEVVDEKPLTCLSSGCDLTSHIICLSKLFCEVGQYIPIEGRCPRCNGAFLWGDLVRKYKGCYENFNVVVNTDVDNDFCNSDSE